MAQVVLGYFGPERTNGKTFLAACWQVMLNLILLAVIIVRAALLLAGFTLVLSGTLLLTLGGRRDAAEKIARWRARAAALLRLWIADILRPLRRQHKHPLRVLPA